MAPSEVATSTSTVTPPSRGRPEAPGVPGVDADGRRTWSAADRYWKMMVRVGVLGAVCHVGFLALFAVVGIPVLVALNVGSIVCYGALLWAARGRRSTSILALTAVELISHATVAVWALGWEANFQYYLLLLVPVALQAEGTMRRKVTYAAVAVAAMLSLIVWLGGADPAVEVDPQLMTFLRLANAATYLGLLCYFSFVYVRTVEDAEVRMRWAAERDPLTGLLNRRSFLGLAEDVSRTGAGAGPAEPTWVVFVDIDHFKSINDRFGHAVGDTAIQLVAERISRIVRRGDLVARWGGEEFLVLLPGADESRALDVAERLRASIADPWTEEPHLRNLTVTLGVARRDGDDTIGATILRADEALYRGKEAGRNRVEVAV